MTDGDFSLEVDKLSSLEGDSTLIIDVRDETSFEYGHIPSAVNIPADRLDISSLPSNKKLVLYCKNGVLTCDIVEKLRANGYDAYDVAGGYSAYVRAHITDVAEGIQDKVEEGIRHKFAKKLLAKFCKAIKTYELLSPGDKVAVCMSGGKDSMLMAKLFQELKRHNKFDFELVFLVMDPGYSKENREVIERNAQMLGVPIEIFESDIFDSVFQIEKSPCYICARMRRGHLYAKAKELGCNKIALGHHYDDVIETILMGMLFGGQVQTMMPKVKSQNFEGMELIRPMYLIREDDIKQWRDFYKLTFIQCACKFTDTCTAEGCLSSNTGSKRKQTKELIAALKKNDPQVEQNIFKSVENVNLSTVVAYKDKEGKRHSFLDEY